MKLLELKDRESSDDVAIGETTPELGARAKSSTSRCNGSGWCDVHFAKVLKAQLGFIYIKGEGAVEKAVKLSGCECDDVKGCKFVAKKHIQAKRLRGNQSTGYTIPDWYIQKVKRAKMAKE
ncbi:unnamed protein product [Arabis nemorensis]|uniref:Uncharacterized protein n=1 Tax=Arabis nemorensis TaxID=586526 RepID=A0A565CK92_9BRAS|nr:unnamed protein product [Arabis nemorensis]